MSGDNQGENQQEMGGDDGEQPMEVDEVPSIPEQEFGQNMEHIEMLRRLPVRPEPPVFPGGFVNYNPIPPFMENDPVLYGEIRGHLNALNAREGPMHNFLFDPPPPNELIHPEHWVPMEQIQMDQGGFVFGHASDTDSSGIGTDEEAEASDNDDQDGDLFRNNRLRRRH
ncbi:Protein CBG27496 [Caenorhabditis briggsae]|uniref:Protein CBG27496 n=2 Tax=Caenorhabditis briggsae TaxID=6238 RepID=B6IF11_CAEBR|nr:Protein CBG27496 [Caenorhabditis briggsae]ULT80594.1 hypothetical protein L3Y34_010871 [Caenorhabditis briggsae]CAR98491.1 Protein CBG27496 [Caenorhabditis briggsae]